MVEDSSLLLRPADQSIEVEPDAALEPEPESDRPTPEPASDSGFVCDCDELMRSACKGLPFYKEQESRRYCVLHYPGKEKSADFKKALDSRLDRKEFDFRGVWFPDEVDFNRFEFGADANFSDSTFSASAYFSDATFSASAYFNSATFSEAANFRHATFSADAYFSLATFGAAASFSSATFSADAYFSSATFNAAAYFSYATFSANAYFSAATFMAVAYFSSSTFSADASFSSATFGEHASFSSARFGAAASFSSATFSAVASFRSATFSSKAEFSEATFRADANFRSITISDADFNLSVFHACVDFSHASFNNSLHFFGSTTERQLKDDTSLAARTFGKDPSLDFQHVRIEHPERIAFHTLILRPHWFVNVDSRHFVFTDVAWEWNRLSIKQEIAALAGNWSSGLPNRLLGITCRQLAENAEANNRYEEASNFRYWAMDLARRMKWKRWTFWKTDWLHMLYWAVSGYGERILRALAWLIGIWIVFAVLYIYMPGGFKQETTNTSSEQAATIAGVEPPREVGRVLIYSFGVMSLQKPEPKPLTGTAQTLVLLETILGPVQAALLALAIRRKFMR